jgi:phosphatidylserine/phosphatidylglycerophosphate/cardiolipin synthase-like enzyme
MPVFRRILVSLVVASVMLGVTAEGAAAYVPSGGAVFNNPYGDQASRSKILRHVLAAIEHARKGSTIRIAVYSFDRRSIADALIAAHRRGVHVQVVINDNWTSPQIQRTRRVLGTNPDKSHFIVICTGSCRGGFGNQHMKIYMFTHTGDAKNVVMNGSANLTNYAAVNQFNDLFTLKNAPRMLASYTEIFNQLKRDHRVRDPYRRVVNGPFISIFNPHPDASKANDPVLQRLQGVRCSAKKGYGHQRRTVVRITMYGWAGDRGIYLAKRVAEMGRRGCNIRVILSNGGGKVAKTLLAGHVKVRSADVDKNRDGQLEKFTHEKYMALSGTYQHKSTRSVWTGSENWSGMALRNDEVTVRIPRSSTYGQYLKNFNFIWSRHSHTIGRHYGESPRMHLLG